jgi:hypothetical protein
MMHDALTTNLTMTHVSMGIHLQANHGANYATTDEWNALPLALESAFVDGKIDAEVARWNNVSFHLVPRSRIEATLGSATDDAQVIVASCPKKFIADVERIAALNKNVIVSFADVAKRAS